MSEPVVSADQRAGGNRPWFRTRVVLVVLASVMGITAASLGVVNNADADAEPITITTQFADASPLVVRNDVKVDGVKVGEVSAMTVSDNREYAEVAITLDPEAQPVHTDAKATIKPVSLLGERYIDLDRGSPSAPALQDGDVLPLKQTGTYTDLDQILNTFDEPTGESMAALVTMLGEGLRGNGRNTDATIRALAPAMRDTGGLVKILRQQNTLLNGVVDKLQPVASSLARGNGAALDRLVASTQTLTETTGARRAQLSATLRELPGTLRAARSTLGRLTGTARATTPVLAEIRPVTGNLSEISAELERFADTADPALASATPVLRKAQRLLDEARPTVHDLRAAGPDLRSSATNLRRLATELIGNLDNVLEFIRGWALTTNGRDGISHYFRASITAIDSLDGLIPGKERDDGKPQDTAPRPELPRPQQGLTGGLLSPGIDDDGGATGLSPKQESGLVEFLIGGGR